jgi:hypothetical protein
MMNLRLPILAFSKIRLTHGLMVTDGTLVRLFRPDRFEIVLPPSGIFSDTELRMPVTDAMLTRIQLMPDGSFRMEF